MSTNMTFRAEEVTSTSVVFYLPLSKQITREIWDHLGINPDQYPDGTGSVFRDVPGRLALLLLNEFPEFDEVRAFRHYLECAVKSSEIEASVFWS